MKLTLNETRKIDEVIMVDGKTEAMLIDQWEVWCSENNINPMSADEVLFEYDETLTWDQKRYIQDFIETWEELMEEQFHAYVAKMESI